MKLKSQLILNFKTSGVIRLLVIGLIYGFVYGSIVGGLSSGFQIKDILLGFFNMSVLFVGIFLVIMATIYTTVSIKIFLSMSMSKKQLIQMWSQYTIINVAFMTMLFYIFVFINLVTDKVNDFDQRILHGRILNMNLDDLSVLNILLIGLIIVLFTALFFVLAMSMGLIANNYGWRFVVSACFVLISLIISFGPQLIFYLHWGKNIPLIILTLILLNIGWIVFCRKELIKTEVVK